MTKDFTKIPISDVVDGVLPIIDMADTSSPILVGDKYKSILLYIRNCGIDVELDFTNCDLESKIIYLKLFLFNDIDIDSDILITTWLEILYSKYEGSIMLPSILTMDEISTFIEVGQIDINQIHEFINSLPILSLIFSNHKDDAEELDGIDRVPGKPVCLTNFKKIVARDEFLHLIEPCDLTMFYEIFNEDNEHELRYINSLLPYTGLLNIFRSPKSEQEKFINGLTNMIETRKGVKPHE